MGLLSPGGLVSLVGLSGAAKDGGEGSIAVGQERMEPAYFMSL